MLKSRILYLVLIFTTIILGLLSRHFSFIPIFIGDILWATMVYFIMRFLFIAKPVNFSVWLSIAFSFCIEFSQLYKAPWIDNVRHTLFGRLVLGDTFVWTDLLCYILGILIGAGVDLALHRLYKNR